MARKIKDKSIELDTNNPNALSAEDLIYSGSQSVKEKLDASTKLSEWDDTKGAYSIDDFVAWNGSIWKAIQANDFNSPKEPGVDVSYWKDISDEIIKFEPVDSYILAKGSNGYGSTYTAIRRFAAILEEVGTNITYADSATDGATFTINKDGLYLVEMVDTINVTDHIGVSVNGDPTQNIYEIPEANRLIHLQTYLTNMESGSTVAKLYAGDVVRMHSRDTNGEGTGSDQVKLKIARIGDLESGGSFTRSTFLLDVWKTAAYTVDATGVTVLHDQIDTDKYNAYNPATGEWTAPADMEIEVAAKAQANTAGGAVWLYIIVNGSSQEVVALHNLPGLDTFSIRRSMAVSQGDTISIFAKATTTQDFSGGSLVSWFQIKQELAGDASPTDKGEQHEFTSADLVADTLTITHQLGQQHVLQTMMDNNGEQVVIWPTFVNNNTIQYDLTGITVTGTWSVVLGIGGRSIGELMTADQKDVVDSNYSVVNVDGGKTIDMDSSFDTNINIQTYAVEPITRAGQEWVFTRLGTGQVQVNAPAGVTLNGIDGGTSLISNQYDAITLRCKDPVNNVWLIFGGHAGVS